MGIVEEHLPPRAVVRTQGENAEEVLGTRWLLLPKRQFSLLRERRLRGGDGFVLGVEGWIIIVIILLFLLTPGAMLSTLNALSPLIPSDLMRQFFFFFNLCGWKLRLSKARQFAPSHTARWRSKILNSSAITWGGGGA